mmetsp:Transcript_16597/g.56602  ORF Transcript_16597/g.56602 Transcript_16597/m.56602 type:complete len:209 (-) Transcript_16597:1358-1984(-)
MRFSGLWQRTMGRVRSGRDDASSRMMSLGRRNSGRGWLGPESEMRACRSSSMAEYSRSTEHSTTRASRRILLCALSTTLETAFLSGLSALSFSLNCAASLSSLSVSGNLLDLRFLCAVSRSLTPLSTDVFGFSPRHQLSSASCTCSSSQLLAYLGFFFSSLRAESAVEDISWATLSFSASASLTLFCAATAEGSFCACCSAVSAMALG